MDLDISLSFVYMQIVFSCLLFHDAYTFSSLLDRDVFVAVVYDPSPTDPFSSPACPSILFESLPIQRADLQAMACLCLLQYNSCLLVVDANNLCTLVEMCGCMICANPVNEMSAKSLIKRQREKSRSWTRGNLGEMFSSDLVDILQSC